VVIGRPYPGDTYNPRHWLRQNPGHRYSQSPWQPKKTAIRQMREGNNYVIPLSTYVPEPNPYTDRRWARMEAMRRRRGITHLPAGRTAEEIGRNSFDIDWRYLGTH
jgi:hypothetical protein